MSREEPRGFFRGAEFSRVVILGGLLAVGWPLVVYYGFARSRPADRPRPAPIASLPPLPAADPAPELAAVMDKEPAARRDDPAKALLLDRVRKTPPEALASAARREVAPIDLLRNPRRYRGLPIRLEGYASEVFAVDDIDPDLTPSGRLYEVWIRPEEHDQRLYPVCLVAETVPATLPGGKGLAERVAIEGYFLKLVVYRAGDGNRYAPLLIGRLAHSPGEAGERPRERSRFWTFLPLVLLLAYLSARMVFVLRKTLAPARAGRRVMARDDRIEPEVLDAWLRSPDPPPEGHGDEPRLP